MKLAYKDYPVWGINFISSRYWLFRGTNINDKVRLPGVSRKRRRQFCESASISVLTASQTVFFDRIGKPYSAYTDETNNTPLAGTMTIKLSSGGPTREIKITPETGLIR